MDFIDLRDEIARRMEAGTSLDDIEAMIEETNFSPDIKSALWLFGWSYLPVAQQRARAMELSGALMEGFTSGATEEEEVSAERLRAVMNAVEEHEQQTQLIRHPADNLLYRRAREAMGSEGG